MKTRFLHTADWQLGARRSLLAEEAQARYAEARIAAIERIGALARESGAAFVVVAGDVFESNQVGRRTVGRAVEAMKGSGVPFYLLPGNHDPLDSASVYAAAELADAAPAVNVARGGAPVQVAPGLELVSAPWFSKRPTTDLAGEALAELDPAPGVARILLAHGAVDAGHPKPETPWLIRLAALDAALDRGAIHYVALGDRHSKASVGDSGRIWYAGTPEPTAFREVDPGWVLEVSLDGERVEVEPRAVGRWRFVERSFELATREDLAQLEEWLDALPDKRATALRLTLSGQLSLRLGSQLDSMLDRVRDLVAALDLPDRGGVISVPDELDRDALGLSGFAAEAVDALLAEAREGGESARAAHDALALLYRLSVEAPKP